MCNYYVDLNEIANIFKVELNYVIEITSFYVERFKDFIEDEVLFISNYKMKINNKGRIIIRNIAMRFDPLMRKNINSYSKTI